MNGRGGLGDGPTAEGVMRRRSAVYFSLLAACSSASFDYECSTCTYPSILTKRANRESTGYNSKAKETVAHQSKRQVFEDLTALALIRGRSKLKRVRHVRA
uniref:Secreted protein n=1 Tax=Trichuris muris TaxID=70415 RepID=A0A5S6QN30_TRIMR